jgi:chromosome segregation ATPase
MLSLAFILTVAMNGRSSLYIMDEVDAALDEQNQRRVAALVKVSASYSFVSCFVTVSGSPSTLVRDG